MPPKRKRVVPAGARPKPPVPSAPMDDRWPGWGTIESEPFIFSQLLRDFGCANAKVVDCFAADVELMAPYKDAHGFIFLFGYKVEETIEEEISCPDGLWFANQTIDNACGTMALLNIIMNSTSVVLGDAMTSFKAHSTNLTPPQRGQDVANNAFIREAHNSFVREAEKRAIDVNFAESFKKRDKKVKNDEYEESDAFHFCAYVYVDGHAWELDGLKRQPYDLGAASSDTWYQLVGPRIQHRITLYSDEEMRFSILAVVPDKRIALRKALEDNKAKEEAFQAGPNGDSRELVKIVHEQEGILRELREEDTEHLASEETARRAQVDYVPFFRKMAQILHEKGIAEELLRTGKIPNMSKEGMGKGNKKK